MNSIDPVKNVGTGGITPKPLVYSEDNFIKLIRSLQYRNPFDPLNDPAIKLIGIKDPKLVPLLIEALKDIDSNIRQGAAFVLGSLYDKSSVRPLADCLKDKDLYVRATAANSLKKLKDIRAVKPLIECLNDSATEVRRSVVIALGTIGTEEAFNALKVVTNTEVDKTIRDLIQVILRRQK